jgi:hypothetical protein
MAGAVNWAPGKNEYNEYVEEEREEAESLDWLLVVNNGRK